MNEGVAIVGSDGTTLFCNAKLSGILKMPLERITGASLTRFVPQEHTQTLKALLNQGLVERQQTELTLKAGDGRFTPVRCFHKPPVP